MHVWCIGQGLAGALLRGCTHSSAPAQKDCATKAGGKGLLVLRVIGTSSAAVLGTCRTKPNRCRQEVARQVPETEGLQPLALRVIGASSAAVLGTCANWNRGHLQSTRR